MSHKTESRSMISHIVSGTALYALLNAYDVHKKNDMGYIKRIFSKIGRLEVTLPHILEIY